jgi:PPM family protein phosphatase
MKTFSITDVGRHRDMNQDFVFTSERPIGKLPNLFLVADGMGGHRAGDYASRYTVEALTEAVASIDGENPKEILEKAIRIANHKLLGEAMEHPEMRGMGTTLVAMTIDGHEMTAANVGDSRLYVIGEEITQITKDHSLVQEMVRRGELDENVAKNHPDKNIITRAIGAEETLVIDFFRKNISDGEKILMCSDGLTNMVEDEEIRRIIAGSRDTAEQAEELVRTANENGGRDNITVIVIEPFDEVTTC